MSEPLAHWQALYTQLLEYEPGLGPLPWEQLLTDGPLVECNSRQAVLAAILKRVPIAPRRILLMHGFVVGGVERVAAHAAHAVAMHRGGEDLLILATDQASTDTLEWFAGTGTTLALPTLEPDPFSLEERALLVAQLIRFWRPRAVFNLHSAAGWRALERFGTQLTHSTAWSAGLFCRDRLPNGRPVSHADRYLRSTLPHLERVICDHRGFLDQLIRDFALPARACARMTVLYQPLSCPAHAARPLGKRVLWSGRLCAQKRPDLLVQVAALRPDLAIDVYGPSVSQEQWSAWGLDQYPTIQYCGSYRSFDELPLQRYGVFLLTSDYEGLPNVLLEAGAAGLPIVAMAVGGVPELITSRTGWPVPPQAGALGLAEALDQVFSSSKAAEQRIQACRKLLQTRHAPQRFWQAAQRASTFFKV